MTHLRDVYQHLSAELEREGRSGWLSEEMAVLEARETYDMHPDDAWQRLKMRVKKPVELAVLQRLAAWREREARSRNVPRGRILKDDALYEIAQQQPKDAEALSRLRTIPKGWERSSAGAAVIAAVNEALALPKAEMPKIPRAPQAPEGAGAAMELLKVLLKLIAEKQGVAAKIIANGEDLERIAAEGEKANVDAMHGWRRELFGETALRLIRGDVALRFVDRKVEAVDLTPPSPSPPNPPSPPPDTRSTIAARSLPPCGGDAGRQRGTCARLTKASGTARAAPEDPSGLPPISPQGGRDRGAGVCHLGRFLG